MLMVMRMAMTLMTGDNQGNGGANIREFDAVNDVVDKNDNAGDVDRRRKPDI